MESTTLLAVGAPVYFPRGMFGRWPGRIIRYFEARGTRSTGHGRGRVMAEVSCMKRNGRCGRYVVPADSLTAR